jgi:hypothetical protein
MFYIEIFDKFMIKCNILEFYVLMCFCCAVGMDRHVYLIKIPQWMLNLLIGMVNEVDSNVTMLLIILGLIPFT